MIQPNILKALDRKAAEKKRARFHSTGEGSVGEESITVSPPDDDTPIASTNQAPFE